MKIFNDPGRPAPDPQTQADSGLRTSETLRRPQPELTRSERQTLQNPAPKRGQRRLFLQMQARFG